MKKLSKKDNNIITVNIINKKFKNIKELLDEENEKVVYIFIKNFIICETCYKIILDRYLKLKKKKTTLPENMKIHLTQVTAALSYCGFDFDAHIIESIFKSKTKRGQNSAKILRNGIVHNLQIEDIKEVILRKDELFTYMNTFINGVMNKNNAENSAKEAAVALDN